MCKPVSVAKSRGYAVVLPVRLAMLSRGREQATKEHDTSGINKEGFLQKSRVTL